MLHCNIAKYFVTMVAKPSINQSHKQDDKTAKSQRTAKFGENSARSGRRGRSNAPAFCFGDLRIGGG